MGVTIHYNQKKDTRISDEKVVECLARIEIVARENNMEIRYVGSKKLNADAYDYDNNLICEKGSEAEMLVVLPHPEAETAEFTFANGKLCSLHETNDGEWRGSDTIFCKTQFCGVPGHLQLCKLLMILSSYIELEVYDEGDFWEKWDVGELAKNLGENQAMIDGLVKQLEDQGWKDKIVVGGKS